MRKPEEVTEFEKLESQIHSTRREMVDLSKKRPNDPLNKFKLNHLNALLEKCNALLSEDVPLDGFATFNEDQMPSNSDATFVLAHYSDALHRFRVKNTKYANNRFFWILTSTKQIVSAPNPTTVKYRD
jgi:hypothetical protein